MKNTAKRSLAVILAVIMLLSCVGVSTYAAAKDYIPIRIHCTMYGDTTSQRGFNWFTEKNCDTVVEVVKAGYGADFEKAIAFEGTSKEFQGYYSHKVVATGLEKGTTYYYRVGSLDEGIWSETGKFVTDNGDGKFSFIALADVQASNLDNFKAGAKVLDAARKTDVNAEFYVNLGDFVNDCTNEEWNWYSEAFGAANTNLTIVPVAGNHEGNPTNKLNPGWFDNTFNLEQANGSLKVNGVYYSFDYGNAHFCVLNSNDMYPMTEMQRNWIINDLNQSTAHWKFVLLHRAAYSAGKNINKPDTLAMRSTIIDIVDMTDVDMVFSGHDHMYMRTKQVRGDAVVEDYTTVTEVINGVETTIAKNPDGAVFVLPSTAGTKRYDVNANAIDPINACADAKFSTKNQMETIKDADGNALKDADGNEIQKSVSDHDGGCFADVKIDGNKLIYTAYVVDDASQEITQVDSYGIIKDEADDHTDERELNTSIIKTIDGSVYNTFTEIIGVLMTYLTKLLPQVIKGLVGGLF